jgi:hypothetical protein
MEGRTAEIVHVYIDHLTDEDPDYSYFGEFSDKPGKFAIHHSNDPRTCTYFNANEDTCETQEHAQQHYERMLAYERGEWHYVGIQARADIATPCDSNSRLHNDITSGGVWGVESDSGIDHMQELETGQLNELKEALVHLGFTSAQIDVAFKDVSRKED